MRTRLHVMLACAGALTLASAAPSHAMGEASTLAGLSGATLLDSGTMTAGDGGYWGREEVFELLRLEDGRHVLLNTVTAHNGRYRVRARFDMDADFNMTTAHGVGLYDGTPVDIAMRRQEDGTVAIRVTGDDIDLSPTVPCGAGCYLNMSPSMTAMYVMTRHYDHDAGGAQRFEWISQDLDQEYTMVGGKADLVYEGDISLTRADGSAVTIRHYTFVEELPRGDGAPFIVDFDLWTDAEERPMGFLVSFRNGDPPVAGFRHGWEDVRDRLIPSDLD